MRKEPKPSPTESPLLFEIDPVPRGTLTALGGIPLGAQAFRSLGLPQSVQDHVRVKERERGYDEATFVESFVILHAAGGECAEDFKRLREDAGLAEMLGHALPSPAAALQFLDAFHQHARGFTAAIQAVPEAEWQGYGDPQSGRNPRVCGRAVRARRESGEEGYATPPLRRHPYSQAPGGTFDDGSRVRHFAVLSNRWELNAAALIAWHREKAGTIELVHDVIKNELGGGVLPSKYFGANAAWLRLAVIAHNVLTALKRLALPAELLTARPKRLRFLFFNMPGRLVHHARRLCCGWPAWPSALPPTARACSCCPCRPEPAGAKKAQLSTDLPTPFSNRKLKCYPFSGRKSRSASAACKNRNQPCQARG